MSANAGEAVAFGTDIKPLFRERDRDAMEFAFDLWSYEDVTENADGILARVRNGSMPCDMRWDRSQIDLFESWIAGGKAR